MRSGFLWYQTDTAYMLICLVRLLGGIKSSRDFKERFFVEYYRPYLARLAAGSAPGAAPEPLAQASTPGRSSE